METTQSTPQERPSVLDLLMAAGLALFLALLPFHLVIKKLIPGPLGTYWKEILLGLLVLLWVVRCIRARRVLLTSTPLDGAVLFYLAVLLLRYALDGFQWVGAWGLYISILYLPLFWLVPAVLQSLSGEDPRRGTDWTKALMALLVAIGAVVAVGGLVEFALNRPLWPSEEMLQRQGFSSMFIYGTQIRRVYFTFDSPTTLANTLAMLLPLALALVMIARNPWGALAAWLAAALMGVCIVVTFSRGIWVSTVVALVVMAILSGFVRRRRRILLLVAGVLAVIVLAWVLVLAVRQEGDGSTHKGVVELSPAAYQSAPILGVHQDLLLASPIQGRADVQTWTLLDPITAQDDARPVLYQHPPEKGKDEVIYAVQVPEGSALRLAIAMPPETWAPYKGDGVTFQIYVSEPDSPQPGQPVFVRYINPKDNPSDRRWRNYLVDLAPWVGRTVHLSLSTESGPVDDWTFDWAGWADLQVVGVDAGYFASLPAEGAVLRHTRSITDWVRDESNRDRLAAWSQALQAWRAAPLWGQGLGSTGVAALRTQHERAFVTESQVFKALVELGPLGLLALVYLWFQIAHVGYLAYRDEERPTEQALLLGILTSLLVVFIEGLVYQNLEVKQVNAYFWTLVGILAFLARYRSAKPETKSAGQA